VRRRGDPGELAPADDSVVRAAREDADSQDDTNAQLRAMRSVWLSMREEDPPDGGLVDLLAAARAKAATMRARPTLWQRVLAVLKRPPALAFATVVVLVGGAVLFIGRGKGMHADLAAGSSGAMKPLAQPPEPLAQPAEPLARAVVGEPAKLEQPARVEKAGGVMERLDAPRAVDVEPARQPVVRAQPPARASAHTDARKQELLEKMYKQCVTAARRGDCEAVRKMVVRIAKTDRNYRARVANEEAVATCLSQD